MLATTLRTTNKDIDKLNHQYAKGKIYERGVIKEQEAIIPAAEKRIKEIDSDQKLIQKHLQPYTKGKPIDNNYKVLKEQYENNLQAKASLQKAINVASESITASKLSYIGENG